MICDSNQEFYSLNNFYEFENKSEVKKFIQENPNIIIILNEMKDTLESRFPDGEFILSINKDFETSEKTLLINIEVDKYTFDNGVMENIEDIDLIYAKLMQNLKVVSKVFLNPTCNDFN